MRMSIAIMAHRKRQAWAERLAGQLDCPIAWDSNDHLWTTARFALEMFDDTADYHLVLQDDAVLCDRFVEIASDALDHANGLPVCFCMPDRPWRKASVRAARRAWDSGHSWVEDVGPLNGVAVAHPVGKLPRLLAAVDTMDVNSYDTRCMRGYRDHLKMRCRYTIPCLVDHRDTPSLHTPGKPHRPAWRMLDGQPRDWSKRPMLVKASR